MPTTRAMARKVPAATEDKENDPIPALRKKPVRAKAAASKKTTKAQRNNETTLPDQNTKTDASKRAANILAPKRSSQVRARAQKTQQPVPPFISVSDPIIESPTARDVSRLQHQQRLISAPTRPTTQETCTRDREPSNSRSSGVRVRLAAEDQDTAAQPAQRRGTKSWLVAADRAKHGDRHTSSHDSLQGTNNATTRRSLAGTPLQDKNLSMPPPYHHGFGTIDSLRIDSSDDELCGAKTPLRRKKHPKNVNRTSLSCTSDAHDPPTLVPDSTSTDLHTAEYSPAASAAPFQTLTPHLDMPSTHEHQYTQKLPLRPAAPSSVDRSAPTPRGSNVRYVFHSLGRSSRANRPLEGRYDWPVTPSDNEDSDPMDRAGQTASSRRSATSRATTPASRRTKSEYDARDTLNQVFASTFGDDSDDDSNTSDEDDEDIPALRTLKRQTVDEFPANTDFVPADGSDSGSDLDDGADASILSEVRQLDQAAILAKHHISTDDTSMIDQDGSVASPQLHSGIIDYASSQITSSPRAPSDHEDSSDSSDDELGETPTLTRVRDLEPTTHTLSPESSFVQTETPRAQSSTKTSQLQALLLKTPHMRSALDEFDFDQGITTSTHDHPIASTTVCVDPSMLSQDGPPLPSPRKDSVQVGSPDLSISPAKITPAWTTNISGPSPEKTYRPAARLSMLLDVDALVESPRRESPAPIRETSLQQLQPPTPEMTPCASPCHEISDDEQSEHSSIDHSVICHNGRTADSLTYPPMSFLLDQPKMDETPHYALPTVAYDARRKSMPVQFEQTPQAKSMPLRFANADHRTADTRDTRNVWVQDKTPRSIARRRSLFNMTPSGRDSQPSSLPRLSTAANLTKKISTPSLINTPRVSQSFASNTPRPRSYTPSQALTSLKMTTHNPAVSARRFLAPSSRARSPTKTPPRTKAHAALSPSKPKTQAAFTPHPSAPLRGILAYVEIFTRAGSDASASFTTAIRRLGGQIAPSLTEACTHVVFKDGNASTTAQIRAWRRDDALEIFVVNSRWVTDCDAQGKRMPELDAAYAVDVHGVDAVAASVASATRKRESMEPRPLARTRVDRLSVAEEGWGMSPVKNDARWEGDGEGNEVDADESWLEATPRPVLEGLVVPDTMPVSRVRKLDFGVGRVGRRLTAWGE